MICRSPYNSQAEAAMTSRTSTSVQLMSAARRQGRSLQSIVPEEAKPRSSRSSSHDAVVGKMGHDLGNGHHNGDKNLRSNIKDDDRTCKPRATMATTQRQHQHQQRQQPTTATAATRAAHKASYNNQSHQCWGFTPTEW